jgi:hypothetical protein
MVFGSIAFGQTVTSTYDKDYGLSKLKTYQFKVEERDKSDPLATDTIMEKKTEDALDDELQSNGYHPPSDGTLPDFLISFHVKTKDKTGERGREWSYVQGTLIVDFYDTETKKLIWRGIASDVVGREEVDLKLAEELVKKAAKLLLEQFNKDLFAY